MCAHFRSSFGQIAEISDPRRPDVESSAQSTSIHPDHLPRAEAATTVVTPCPVKAGDVVLFTSLAIHRSSANRSDTVRWAADIRYQVPAAGNCFPAEASFLAASADPLNPLLVTDWREYVALRSSHVVEKIRPGSSIAKGTERDWRPARGEVFASEDRHVFEGKVEHEGRLRAAVKQAAANRLAAEKRAARRAKM